MSVTRQLHIADTEELRNFMTIALKVAFATTDMLTVNQHFGSAKAFAMYAVTIDHAELLSATQFGELSQDGNEDKLAVKIQLLADCAAVYCQAIGASAINQLLSKGIQPVKVHEDSKIADLIMDLQNELKAGPSSWLAKAIKQKSGEFNRFDAMAQEDWQE